MGNPATVGEDEINNCAAATTPTLEKIEIAIVGAGLAGLYALHKFRTLGLSAKIIEAGYGVGGTWYWNRYPGARCDVESYQYSYSFSDELQNSWRWSERYATQPEIRRYLDHVADRFDLRRDIILGTRVVSGRFSEESGKWLLGTDQGTRIEARYCLMATGVLSKPRAISFPGETSFEGTILHTSHWPDEPVDLRGKRVAIVGTGASGTQAIPLIAKEASELVIFQRTPNFSVPTNNGPVDDDHHASWIEKYSEVRARQRETPAAIVFDFGDRAALSLSPYEVEEELERRWNHDGGLNLMRAFSDLGNDIRANEIAAEFVRGKIRQLVKDPETARLLTPTGYPIDSRRLATTDREFFSLFNKSNIKLVSMLDEPIHSIELGGIRTSRALYEVDVIVMATGFESIIGAISNIDLVCSDGKTIAEKWREFPAGYLGLSIAGLPNLFMINGPGAIGSLANLFVTSEYEVDWIGDCICYMREKGFHRVEASQSAQDDWMRLIQEGASGGLVIRAPTSGYVHESPKGDRIFMCYPHGFVQYRKAADAVKNAGYTGFVFE